MIPVKGLILVACVLYIVPAVAELYRFVNEDGITVLSGKIPARYARNGYTILSNNGQILEVVPGMLTEEERGDLERRLALEKIREEKETERQLADEALLRIYSAPADVLKVRDAKLESIEGFIQSVSINLARLQSEKRSVQSQLADIERSGRTISKDRLAQIASIEERIAQRTEEIETKRKEIEQIVSLFEAELERVTKLYSPEDTLPSKPPI